MQFVLLFKIEKNIKNLYCTCKPLLLVEDDNYANKEYEEANEQGIVVRRWRCIFCWSGRIVSHYGVGRPCYPASGKLARSWN
jgi:hypothetical protein